MALLAGTVRPGIGKEQGSKWWLDFLPPMLFVGGQPAMNARRREGMGRHGAFSVVAAA